MGLSPRQEVLCARALLRMELPVMSFFGWGLWRLLLKDEVFDIFERRYGMSRFNDGDWKVGY